MSILQATGLLICPICHTELALAERVAHCASGHSFDVAKQGYLNLLNAPEPQNADTAAMLSARGRIQQAGVFAPLAETLSSTVFSEAILSSVASPSSETQHDKPQNTASRDTENVIMDVGAGTGYYLAAMLHKSTADTLGIAMDISKSAARIAARLPNVAAIIADTWKLLPVCNGGVDVLTCIFAPRNLNEFARVLRPGGILAIVTPNPGHLHALRSRYDLLDIRADKEKQLANAHFTAVSATTICYPISLPPSLATDIIAMGPNAFHHSPTIAATTATLDDHIDVTLHILRRN